MCCTQNVVAIGNKVVLMLGANEDVKDGMLVAMGLVSVLKSRFGQTTIPMTYQRGSVPIDDIFVSQSITTARVGILELGNGPRDHMALLIDVKQSTLIGDDSFKIHRQPA